MVRTRKPWFSIRKELSRQQQLLLTFGSFSIPILLWCLVSYLPFLWHPDIVIQISGDRTDVATVYVPGDRLPRHAEGTENFSFYDFAAAVRTQNGGVLAAAASGVPMVASRRDNRKILRHLHPVGVAEGILSRDQATDDAALFELWKAIATGELVPRRIRLSGENMNVVRYNWERLSALSETYDAATIPEEVLLSLVPQGVPANPVYVPAPHEVLATGIHDWTTEPVNDKPSMVDRLRSSVWIVFSGFALSCLIGVPIGILCGTYDFFAKLFEPFIDFFRYMPAPAFGTVLVAIFSVYDAPKIALVFIGTFFQMVLVLAKTTRQLDHSLLEAAQTLGAKNRDLVFRVTIPGIMPNLYNDLRILLGWSWTWLVIAELIGTKSGLTEFIETQGRFRNFDSVYPTIIVIGLAGFFTDQMLAMLRPLLFPWKGSDGGKKPGPPERFVRWLLDRDCYVVPERNRPVPSAAKGGG